VTRRVCMVVALAALVAWTPNPATDDAPRPGFTRLPGLEDRLGELTPGDPSAYLRLGEEAAAVGDSRLACELLARAIKLGAGGVDRRAAGSAALALATLVDSPDDRGWLRALAWSIDPERQRPDWSRGGTDERAEADTGSPDAAAMLWLYLAGESHRARLLDSPETRAALAATPELDGLRRGSIGALIARLDDGWPCPECVGQRFTVERVGDRRIHHLCAHCLGNPGATLDRAELIAALRGELRLERAAGGSWSASIAGGQNDPVGDPDPGELGERLGLDLDAVVWRGGRWVPARP